MSNSAFVTAKTAKKEKTTNNSRVDKIVNLTQDVWDRGRGEGNGWKSKRKTQYYREQVVSFALFMENYLS